MIAEELVHHPVDVVGGDAGLAVLPGQDHRLGRQPSGHAHPLDHLGWLDVAIRPPGFALSDVLRSRNMGRHITPR